MLFCENRKLIFVQIFLVFFVLQKFGTTTETVEPTTKAFVAKKIFKLLNKLENSRDLDSNTKFTAILAEFLIKQKVRFYEATRFEEQIYFKILQKLNGIIKKTDDSDYSNVYRRILDNIFQKDILLIPPTLKERHIDVHMEYDSLLPSYEELVDTGVPNATLSGINGKIKRPTSLHHFSRLTVVQKVYHLFIEISVKPF
ncbi:uncharacterized protein LOC119675029 [Teleopsis dalmanni]|uniref:uncharacterized protein LOC119675029 n=1 Tax=Teleopsis dalmanni TaxID=139649 RepID=UPI0018CCFB16|nr:uncharacterized protein LOC119675029 [Teleopsis dalmanni]